MITSHDVNTFGALAHLTAIRATNAAIDSDLELNTIVRDRGGFLTLDEAERIGGRHPATVVEIRSKRNPLHTVALEHLPAIIALLASDGDVVTSIYLYRRLLA